MLWRILNTGFSCPLQVGSYSKRCPREPKGEATLLTLVPEMLLGLIARNLSGLAIGIAAEVLRWTGTAILTELARKRMDGPVQRQPESTWYPVSPAPSHRAGRVLVLVDNHHVAGLTETASLAQNVATGRLSITRSGCACMDGGILTAEALAASRLRASSNWLARWMASRPARRP
jgi:hypothetical protein